MDLAAAVESLDIISWITIICWVPRVPWRDMRTNIITEEGRMVFISRVLQTFMATKGISFADMDTREARAGRDGAGRLPNYILVQILKKRLRNRVAGRLAQPDSVKFCPITTIKSV